MIRNGRGTALAAILAIAAPVLLAQQPKPLLSTKDALELSQRIVERLIDQRQSLAHR